MFQLIKAIVSNINDQWPNDRWHGNARDHYLFPANIRKRLEKRELRYMYLHSFSKFGAGLFKVRLS